MELPRRRRWPFAVLPGIGGAARPATSRRVAVRKPGPDPRRRRASRRHAGGNRAVSPVSVRGLERQPPAEQRGDRPRRPSPRWPRDAASAQRGPVSRSAIPGAGRLRSAGPAARASRRPVDSLLEAGKLRDRGRRAGRRILAGARPASGGGQPPHCAEMPQCGTECQRETNRCGRDERGGRPLRPDVIAGRQDAWLRAWRPACAPGPAPACPPRPRIGARRWRCGASRAVWRSPATAATTRR